MTRIALSTLLVAIFLWGAPTVANAQRRAAVLEFEGPYGDALRDAVVGGAARAT